MRLAKLSEYRRLVYTPDSAPTLATLRKNIQKIPGGVVIHGRHWVDLDKLDGLNNLREKVMAEQATLAANPLLAGLI